MEAPLEKLKRRLHLLMERVDSLGLCEAGITDTEVVELLGWSEWSVQQLIDTRQEVARLRAELRKKEAA